MATDAKAKSWLLPIVGGRRYSRGPTDTNPPTAPQWVVGSDPVPNQTTISILWVNGVDAETGIKDALCQIRPNGTTTWTTSNVTYPGTSFTFTGLTAGTPYDIQVANRDNASPTPNTSSFTSIKTVTTTGVNTNAAPGTISIAPNSVTVNENGQLSIGITRSGAGPSSAAVDVQWAFSAFSEGTPTPANGPLVFPAGTNGTQNLTTTAGSVSANRTGVLSIVSATAETGTLQPSIGVGQISVTILNVTTGTKKWNPGHHALSNNPTYPSDVKLQQQIQEQNEVIAQPNVLGIKVFYKTGVFGNSPFDFTKLFRDLNKLRAAGKRLSINLIPQAYGNTQYTDLVPSSVYNSSSYGASPIAGKYGWWTTFGGTSATAAFWRASVMNYYISLFQALATTPNPATGLTVEQDPFVERIGFGETSIAIDAGSDYDNTALVTQYQRLVDTWKQYFPTTVCECYNNFAGTQSLTQQLTNYCVNNGIAVGGPDIVVPGQRGNSNTLSWGEKSVLGVAQSDPLFQGPDLRGVAVVANDFQSPELSDAKRYTMYTPHSFFTYADQTLRQSHMYWCMLNIGTNVAPIPAYPADGPNTGASPGNWGSILQVINGNPVTHIQKPSSIS